MSLRMPVSIIYSDSYLGQFLVLLIHHLLLRSVVVSMCIARVNTINCAFYSLIEFVWLLQRRAIIFPVQNSPFGLSSETAFSARYEIDLYV